MWKIVLLVFCITKVQPFFIFSNDQHVSEWQEDCIIKGATGSNLLISMPTSGGKTLVAEVLIWQQLLLKNHDALFILPYVALVQEKVSIILLGLMSHP